LNYEEAEERSERIACLFMHVTDPRFKMLVQEIARELQRVAMECGWQKEDSPSSLK